MFRFENLKVWQRSVDVALPLFDIADDLEGKRRFRFAEQLRGAALSISNNIAEGSGSTSDRDFVNFLNIARRSVFECANMVLVFARLNLLGPDRKDELLSGLDETSRMITAFSRTLAS